jgi:hypothetical protein
MTCDLTAGPAIVDGPLVSQCNGSSKPFSHNSQLQIKGPQSPNFISIANTALTLFISDLSITAPIPFTANNSSVSIFFAGQSHFTATETDHSGIECIGFSNVSLYFSEDAGVSASGIGADTRGRCNRISVFGARGASVTAAGIGRGVGAVAISGVLELDLRGGKVEAESMVMENATVQVSAGGAPVFSRAPVLSGSVELTVVYERGVDLGSERLVGSFFGVERRDFPAVRLWEVIGEGKRIRVDSERIGGFIMSISPGQIYRARALDGAIKGRLVRENGEGGFRKGGVSKARFVREDEDSEFSEIPPSSDWSEDNSRPKWLTLPVIIGIAGGGVALIAIIVLIIYMCRRRGLRKPRKSDLGFWDSDAPPSATSGYVGITQQTTRYTH